MLKATTKHTITDPGIPLIFTDTEIRNHTGYNTTIGRKYCALWPHSSVCFLENKEHKQPPGKRVSDMAPPRNLPLVSDNAYQKEPEPLAKLYIYDDNSKQ